MGTVCCPCGRKKKQRRRKITSIDVDVDEQSAYEQTLKLITEQKGRNQELDAIIVCGGGRPSQVSQPPLYVQSRCDVAVLLYNHCQIKPKILCLSAGTAHTPQLLNAKQLPVWESYSSAQYILNKYSNVVNRDDFLIETVSYDTIGNAFFAKMLFADVLQWRRMAVITNDWHFDRTKAIFEWIFSIPGNNEKLRSYELLFVKLRSVEDRDLSEEARAARIEREQNSLHLVQQLSKKYDSLTKVHHFLFTEHSCYAPPKLDEEKEKKQKTQADTKLMAAYGFNDRKPGEKLE